MQTNTKRKRVFPMNIILQMKMFGESDFENHGDLKRLQRVLGTLNDVTLIWKLCRVREKGRNDWPSEAPQD